MSDLIACTPSHLGPCWAKYQYLMCQLHFISPQLWLYIHTGSPTVTSLTFDEQSRTLTCTSTGGPATNVTWRRDGVVITINATHQQTKRIVDPVEGIYQTVLTIHPSVGWSNIVGTYTCTVENVRGKSSETVVVPGETRTFTTFTTSQVLHIPVDGFSSFAVFSNCNTKFVYFALWKVGYKATGMSAFYYGTAFSTVGLTSTKHE